MGRCGPAVEPSARQCERYWNEKTQHWKIQRLLLPMASDGRSIDVLMGGAVFLLGGEITDSPAEPWSYDRVANDPPLGF